MQGASIKVPRLCDFEQQPCTAFDRTDMYAHRSSYLTSSSGRGCCSVAAAEALHPRVQSSQIVL